MADELNARSQPRLPGHARSGVHAIHLAGGVVTKRSSADRAQLLCEVAWLQRLPQELRAHFPEVLGLRIGADFAEYDMPHCAWPNFGELLASDQITAPDAVVATHRIVQFAFEQLYTREPSAPPLDFFRHSQLDRLERALQAARGGSRRFDRLLRAPALSVNGAVVENPLGIAQRIAADAALLACLSPPALNLTHGDFKFDNFLIAPSSTDFLLIDPRGDALGGEIAGDYLEDVAMLRTSTLGLYDLVRASRMQLKVDDTDVACECARVAPVAARTLSAIDAALMRWMVGWSEQRGDRNWRLRLRFLVPLLLVAAAPRALACGDAAGEASAVALFATGARMLQSAIEAYAPT